MQPLFKIVIVMTIWHHLTTCDYALVFSVSQCYPGWVYLSSEQQIFTPLKCPWQRWIFVSKDTFALLWPSLAPWKCLHWWITLVKHKEIYLPATQFVEYWPIYNIHTYASLQSIYTLQKSIFTSACYFILPAISLGYMIIDYTQILSFLFMHDYNLSLQFWLNVFIKMGKPSLINNTAAIHWLLIWQDWHDKRNIEHHNCIF